MPAVANRYCDLAIIALFCVIANTNAATLFDNRGGTFSVESGFTFPKHCDVSLAGMTKVNGIVFETPDGCDYTGTTITPGSWKGKVNVYMILTNVVYLSKDGGWLLQRNSPISSVYEVVSPFQMVNGYMRDYGRVNAYGGVFNKFGVQFGVAELGDGGESFPRNDDVILAPDSKGYSTVSTCTTGVSGGSVRDLIIGFGSGNTCMCDSILEVNMCKKYIEKTVYVAMADSIDLAASGISQFPTMIFEKYEEPTRFGNTCINPATGLNASCTDVSVCYTDYCYEGGNVTNSTFILNVVRGIVPYFNGKFNDLEHKIENLKEEHRVDKEFLTETMANFFNNTVNMMNITIDTIKYDTKKTFTVRYFNDVLTGATQVLPVVALVFLLIAGMMHDYYDEKTLFSKIVTRLGYLFCLISLVLVVICWALHIIGYGVVEDIDKKLALKALIQMNIEANRLLLVGLLQ